MAHVANSYMDNIKNNNMTAHYTVLIVGGGAAGISVAHDMRKQNRNIDIAIIEPSEKHYYQPAFTIVGGGAYKLKNALRQTANLIPKKVAWLKERAARFEPDENSILLASGDRVTYDYLVVCPGIQLDWDRIKGLKESLGKNGVCSNYSPDTVEYTWECIQNSKAGDTAVFTQPPMPIKCAGAPQKIMYLAADRFRRQKKLDQIDIQFFNAGPGMFGVPLFAAELKKVAAGYGIEPKFGHTLVEVDGENKRATFEVANGKGKPKRVIQSFDMLHVSPPQSAPDFIKQSPLADAAGWIDVDKATLQHMRYSNIFGLGDATNTPNAKTAAAVRKQVPVLVDNILKLMVHESKLRTYDGYGSCPLTVSLNKVLLAEFSYGGEVTPTFRMNPRKLRRIWWWGKTTGFPWLYWHFMLKGSRIDIKHSAAYAAKYMKEDG